MPTIRAVVNVAQGEAAIKELPYPILPAADYMLVKTTAWAVNPDDPYKLDLPEDETCVGTVIGADFAGYVLEVGSSVMAFKKGDRVAGMTLGQNIIRKHDGAFAEVVAVHSETMMKTPDALSDAEAATQGVSVATMAQALYRGLGLPWPGKKVEAAYTVFIWGGSTAMGIAAIQFAKLSGASVIATASPTNKAYLASLGADHVVDYNERDIISQVRALAGQPIHFALDAYPTEQSNKVIAEVLSRDGKARYISLHPGTEEKIRSLNPTVNASSVLAYSVLGEPYWFEKQYVEGKPEDLALQKSFVPVAQKLLEQGKLKPPRVFLNRGGKGLEGLLCGLEEVRANNVRGGKLVYTVQGDD